MSVYISENRKQIMYIQQERIYVLRSVLNLITAKTPTADSTFPLEIIFLYKFTSYLSCTDRFARFFFLCCVSHCFHVSLTTSLNMSANADTKTEVNRQMGIKMPVLDYNATCNRMQKDCR